MSQKRIIAVDVDEVCADLLGGWLGEYNDLYRDNVQVSDIKTWGLMDYIKNCSEDQFYSLIKWPDFYHHCVDPIPGALETVAALRKLGRVIFVSSCSENTMDQKFMWLRENGFLKDHHSSAKDFIACRDKHLINADVLFDDAVHNVEAFPREAFLVRHTHNESQSCKRPRLHFKDAPLVLRTHLGWS